MKSGQNRRSHSLSSRLCARAGPWTQPGSDQKKFSQSGSSKMKGITRPRSLAMLTTLCWSVALRQLLSTASPSLSTSWQRSMSRFQDYYSVGSSHLEAQFGHDLRVCLLDPSDLGGGDRAVDVLHTGRLLPAEADHLLQASLPLLLWLAEAGHGLPDKQ